TPHTTHTLSLHDALPISLGRDSDAEHRRFATQSSSAVKPLVTITRQYASGGSEIARLVVDRLGGHWTLIDNEFVDQVAHLAGLRSEEHTSELQSRVDLVC